MKKFGTLLFFLCSSVLLAQVNTFSLSKIVAKNPLMTASAIHPESKQQLTQTQIMFDFPEVKGAVTYLVTVFKVSGESKKDTVPVFSQLDSTTATLIEGFEFGENYVWYYTGFNKKNLALFQSWYYAFEILPLPHSYRVNVIKNDKKGQGGLVSFDYAHLVSDRKGEIVWFLKPVKDEITEMDLIRDLRFTPAGTATFVSTKGIFEISVDGRILWKGPQLDLITHNKGDFYHHGFERLPSGNYMAMGNTHELRQIPGDTAHINIEFGTIIEFDRFGKVVWQWDSRTYLTNIDLFSSKTPDGKFDGDTHLNACSQDDSAKYVYAGFRNLNRIVKIEKKTGKVVAVYGNGMYWHQHDSNILPDGTIAIFNNDSIANASTFSSALIFSQPSKPNEQAKIIWKFSCKFDTLTDGKSEKGGNVELLPNGNYLISMGSLHRCVEVNKKRQVVWDAFVEDWYEKGKIWVPVRQYRSHYVSSLYPCYFTTKVSIDSTSKNQNKISVLIFNKGSEADSYLIDFKEGSKEYSTAITTQKIPAQTNKLNVIFDVIDEKKITEIRIRSVQNPDFIRIMKL